MKTTKGFKICIDTDYIKSKLDEEYRDYNLIIGDVEVDRIRGEIDIQYFIVDEIEESD